MSITLYFIKKKIKKNCSKHQQIPVSLLKPMLRLYIELSMPIVAVLLLQGHGHVCICVGLQSASAKRRNHRTHLQQLPHYVFQMLWEFCDHVQSNQQTLIISFYRIFFFSTKELRIEAFQTMQTSEIISIFMYFTRTHIQHMTCTLWSIRLISVSVYLLRPSSQQGQGTFILIYSKGLLSFNFLHIHKRVSHPRSHFPFQP